MRAPGNRTILAAAPFLALLCLAIAGCGGGGRAATTSTGASSRSAPSSQRGASAPVRPPVGLTAKQKYERAMQALGGELESSLQLAGDTELASAGTKSATTRDAKALVKARIALRTAAAKLARIVPPPSVRSAQALLLKGVTEYADELGSVIDQLEAGSPPVAVLQNILRFQGVKDMETASIQIERKGYSIVAG
jgi:hypothetical protein